MVRRIETHYAINGEPRITGVTWDDVNGLWKVSTPRVRPGFSTGYLMSFARDEFPLAVQARRESETLPPEQYTALREKYAALKVEFYESLKAASAGAGGTSNQDAVEQDEMNPKPNMVDSPAVFLPWQRDSPRGVRRAIRGDQTTALVAALEKALRLETAAQDAERLAVGAWDEFAQICADLGADLVGFGKSRLGAILKGRK